MSFNKTHVNAPPELVAKYFPQFLRSHYGFDIDSIQSSDGKVVVRDLTPLHEKLDVFEQDMPSFLTGVKLGHVEQWEFRAGGDGTEVTHRVPSLLIGRVRVLPIGAAYKVVSETIFAMASLRQSERTAADRAKRSWASSLEALIQRQEPLQVTL